MTIEPWRSILPTETPTYMVVQLGSRDSVRSGRPHACGSGALLGDVYIRRLTWYLDAQCDCSVGLRSKPLEKSPRITLRSHTMTLPLLCSLMAEACSLGLAFQPAILGGR